MTNRQLARRHMRLAAIGPYRIDLERRHGARFSYWRGGQATPWPWRELVVPGLGSLILGRRTARKGL